MLRGAAKFKQFFSSASPPRPIGISLQLLFPASIFLSLSLSLSASLHLFICTITADGDSSVIDRAFFLDSLDPISLSRNNGAASYCLTEFSRRYRRPLFIGASHDVSGGCDDRPYKLVTGNRCIITSREKEEEIFREQPIADESPGRRAAARAVERCRVVPAGARVNNGPFSLLPRDADGEKNSSVFGRAVHSAANSWRRTERRDGRRPLRNRSESSWL